MSAAEDVGALLARAAEPGTRERPAMVFYRGRQRLWSTSWGALAACVEAAASHFERRLGVRRGDRVGILAPNRPEVPIALLALLRQGATVLPLNPGATPEDWAWVLRHARARGLVASAELLDRARSHATGLDFAVDAGALFEAPGASISAAPECGDETAVVLYTSGTTGTSKGVALTQRSLLYNARAMADRVGVAGQTQLAVLPLHHAHALGFGLMTALASAGRLAFTAGLDPLAWPAIVREERVAFASVVPTLLPLLLAARVRRERLPTLRALLVSSAPLSRELARSFEEETGIPLVHGWGLSEYTNFACCIDPRMDDRQRRELLWGHDVPSVGWALDGTEVFVAGEGGRVLGEGERGELRIRGPSRMRGYLDDAAASALALEDGALRTGDEGCFRDIDGRRVFFVTGRIKEIVVRDGEKLSPVAIEQHLLALVPALDGRLAVLGFPHDVHGEEVGAYLHDADLADVRGALDAAILSLPATIRPKVVVHGSRPLPRTHTGKLQRRSLVDLFAPDAGCTAGTRWVNLEERSAQAASTIR